MYGITANPMIFNNFLDSMQIKVDCAPYIYSYQTIDTLKEGELMRRQILDYLLERLVVCQVMHRYI